MAHGAIANPTGCGIGIANALASAMCWSAIICCCIATICACAACIRYCTACICRNAAAGGMPPDDDVCISKLAPPCGLCQLHVLTFIGPTAVWTTRVSAFTGTACPLTLTNIGWAAAAAPGCPASANTGTSASAPAAIYERNRIFVSPSNETDRINNDVRLTE